MKGFVDKKVKMDLEFVVNSVILYIFLEKSYVSKIIYASDETHPCA